VFVALSCPTFPAQANMGCVCQPCQGYSCAPGCPKTCCFAPLPHIKLQEGCSSDYLTTHAINTNKKNLKVLYGHLPFTHCAIWATQCPGLNIFQTFAFVAVGHHVDMRDPESPVEEDVAFLARFHPSNSKGDESHNPQVSYFLANGPHSIRIMATFLCQHKDNPTTYEKAPGDKPISDGVEKATNMVLRTKDRLSWARTTKVLYHNDLTTFAKDNKRARQEYAKLGNNCQDYAKCLFEHFAMKKTNVDTGEDHDIPRPKNL